MDSKNTLKTFDIDLHDVSYIYSRETPFEKQALKDVSLHISGGGVTGIIGHTGSGKSTLALLIAGLLTPAAGSISIGGELVYKAASVTTAAGKQKKIRGAKKENRKSALAMRYTTGIIFQYPEYQLFEETVYKDIAYGPTNMGLDPDEIKTRIEKACDFAGVSHELWEKSPFELSGGQKRRVAIAGVMAMDPPVLILDEPAAGLDPRGRAEILGGLCAYQRATGKTMLLISHSMEDMAKYAQKIIVMKSGGVFMNAAVDEVFRQADELRRMGLSVPEVTALFIELRNRGIDINAGVYTVDQAMDEIARRMDGRQRF